MGRPLGLLGIASQTKNIHLLAVCVISYSLKRVQDLYVCCNFTSSAMMLIKQNKGQCLRSKFYKPQ